MNPISMGRRSFVRHLPIAAAAIAAIPAMTARVADAGPDHPDAKLIELMRAWHRAYNAANALPVECDEAEVDRMCAIEAEAAAIQPASAVGFAIKLLMLTCYGDFGMDGPADCLMDDARRISGFPLPAGVEA